LVIQIDINNKSTSQAYTSQTQKCEEFKKLELIKLSINILIVARQIEKLKETWLGFNRALTKVLVTHNLDGNHPPKKIIKEKKTRENLHLE